MAFEILQLSIILLFLDYSKFKRKQYTVRKRRDFFKFWNNEEFLNRFRVSKRTAKEILEIIRPQLEPKNTR